MDGAFSGQVLLTAGFEGRVECNQRRLGMNIPGGGTSSNQGLEMGVFGHWEGPMHWLVAPSQTMHIPIGVGASS